MREECIICSNNLKKINDYVFKCNQCLFYKSVLEPGFGRDIEGIVELRKNNYEQDDIDYDGMGNYGRFPMTKNGRYK